MKLTTQAASFVTLFFLAVVPFFLLPGLIDPDSLQKTLFFAATTVILGLLWVFQTFVTHKAHFVWSRVLTGISLILATTIISSIFTATGNFFQHLSGSPAVWTAVLLFVFFASSLGVKLTWHKILHTLFIPATVLSVIAWLQLTPFSLAAMFNAMFDTVYPLNLSFNPADSLLTYLTFVLPVAAAGLMSFRDHHTGRQHDSLPSYTLPWAAFLFISGVMGLFFVWQQPDVRPLLLPYQVGWTVAVETLKTPRTLLLGLGTDSFLNAFHQLRGLGLNSTPFWATRFSVSSSELFQVLTTTGVLGLAAWAITWMNLGKAVRHFKKTQPSLAVFAGSLFLIFLLVPFSPLVTITFAALCLAVIRESLPEELVNTRQISFSLKTDSTGHFSLRTGVLAGIFFLLIGYSYLFGRVALANYTFGQSYVAAQKNDGQGVYELQQKAMQLHPYKPEYRRAYAATNLAIAQGQILQAQNAQTELTQQQQQLITSLLQQAVREARNAATLDPTSTENWETLASIYNELLNVEGSAEWAVAAHTQAIKTDSFNPQLRLALAQLYLRLEATPAAVKLTEQAAELNPTWAAPYFLYGEISMSQNNPVAAQAAYQRALELLPAASTDRPILEDRIKQAQDLLAELQSQQAVLPASEPLPAPSEPQQPETPVVENPPAGFEALLQNNDQLESTEVAPTPPPAEIPQP